MKTNTIKKSNIHFQFIFGFIMLALSAMGGASSCSNSTDNQVVIETLADSSVQNKVYNMISFLGLTVTQSSSNGKISNQASESNDACIENVIINAGDLIEFGYHDDYENVDTKLKINKNLSTKDTIIFDGTSKNLESGQVFNIRHTFAKTADGLTIKKAPLDDDNNGFTYKYVSANDGVLEYRIKADGTGVYQRKYVANTETSITAVNKDGVTHDLTNISIFKK